MRDRDSARPLTPPPGPNTLRDHFANERTFLAWMRTTIAIVALGFIVARFALLLREQGVAQVHTPVRLGAVVGVILVFGGGITAALATFRFLRMKHDIDHGIIRFRPELDIALAVIVGSSSLILAAYILVTS
jgi:putative membrane protein